MRKKSHLSLVGYLVKNMEVDQLKTHKKAFMIGSIMPDCVPSFLTRKHNIEETFTILKKELYKITDHYDTEKGINAYYCRHLGVVTHYIADYFTFPHNKVFAGSLKEHCSYEEELKHSFRAYVKSDAAKRMRKESGTFQTVDEICEFIRHMHQNYLKAIGTVKEDCHYIVELCYRVVDAILQIFNFKFEENRALEAVA